MVIDENKRYFSYFFSILILNSCSKTIEYGGKFENVNYRNDFFGSLTAKLED